MAHISQIYIRYFDGKFHNLYDKGSIGKVSPYDSSALFCISLRMDLGLVFLVRIYILVHKTVMCLR